MRAFAWNDGPMFDGVSEVVIQGVTKGGQAHS
jgi:hypothetical protein